MAGSLFSAPFCRRPPLEEGEGVKLTHLMAGSHLNLADEGQTAAPQLLGLKFGKWGMPLSLQFTNSKLAKVHEAF